jgi:hypothetical protein
MRYKQATLKDRSRHVWEGWTVGDFINELEPTFNMIHRGFENHNQVKEWVNSEQPYYKKNIPEVTQHFVWLYELYV